MYQLARAAPSHAAWVRKLQMRSDLLEEVFLTLSKAGVHIQYNR